MRLFFTLILLLGVSHLHAQFKNILLDPGTAENKPVDPGIAINPNNPKNLVAVSSLNNVYFSSNSGLSWKKSLIPSSFGIGGHPLLAADFKGNLYFFHLPDKHHDQNQIVVQESVNGGETWTDGVAIEGLGGSKDKRYPRARVDRKGNWYATWTQFDSYGSTYPGCQSMILLSTSSNGKKWSKPIQVSQTPGDCSNIKNSAIGASPAVTAGGERIFIAWANQEKIFFDRSFDGGKMWLSTDLPIAEQPGGPVFNIPGLKAANGMPLLLCDNTKKGNLSGALYIVWADQRNGEQDTDIWFARSTSYGDNWTISGRVNNDGPGKHQFLPSMAIDPTTGYIYIVYYDRRAYDDLRTDVYLAYSTDAGAVFKNVKISETPFTPSDEVSFGDYISISADHGIITPIWTRMDNGQTSIWTAVIKSEDLMNVK